MVIEPSPDGGTLRLHEVPDPEPQPREVLVAVRATALNRADISARRGTYRQQATAKDGALTIGGLECAGEVVAVGADVSSVAVGDRVMGMCGAGFAEYVTMDERLAIRVPERLTWEQAAATPTAFMTEHDALVTNAGFREGESVLIHAAGSAVGLMAVQIASLLGAHPLLGTVASERQRDVVAALGMDIPVQYQHESFREAVETATRGAGVDVVIDHVGGSYLADNLGCMAVRGRLVSVGRLGPTVGELDLDLLAYRRLKLIGVTFRTRTIDEYGDVVRRAVADLWDALDDGRISPVVDRTFPLEDALAAQDYMESNVAVGKIVLCP